MPIVHVSMLSGRTHEQKQQLARGITEVVVQTTGVKAEAVRVLIHEIEPDHWFTGGVAQRAPQGAG